MDSDTEKQVVAALRAAINTAVLAGMSIEYVRVVVKDQLFGIERLGGGDIDKMLSEEKRLEARREMDDNRYRNKTKG